MVDRVLEYVYRIVRLSIVLLFHWYVPVADKGFKWVSKEGDGKEG